MGKYGPYTYADSSNLADGAQSPSMQNPKLTQVGEFSEKNEKVSQIV